MAARHQPGVGKSACLSWGKMNSGTLQHTSDPKRPGDGNKIIDSTEFCPPG